ncbi:carboxypeptidase regulatory-like domain-containing protein [Pseudacidobacterium ailaaui]|jgi:tetratricopeptide (TPR) repeat protein|uniref:carboxypeptidase regulatory-like domain-containing protein n=1 Tax=Pseudacidobacterium ailaaui TaxID=1382359 RepID=UPI00047998F6|nr:carboxypeptidase-like regulatory domain-containing protein [Pseudacidobacterium ailaaui]MBX6360436.1 carboxypeptidase regulatory-like domain-containing protein [Pseudacidobacterium ailaaui]MCL6462946.1 carboxypeptidase-like regulatory domain-containing protein [Pseudacidobacterium ailaaui]MDI3254582.1 carboxypeptidase-like regulatory domain-containing protein [Bacillota bacterium]
MRKMKLWLALAVAFCLPVFAQEQTGKIHGHIQDPAGVAVTDGIVTLSTDGGKTAKYTFKADSNGDYKGDGIAPGTYTVSLRRPDTPADKVLDQFLNVKITAGEDTQQDFDMTRADYISKLTPEQRKQLEELKQKNAEAMKENAVIKNLNADLKQARDDNHNKNFAAAEQLMLKDTQAKPDASVLWLELGVAQAGEKKWPDAETSLKKAIDLESQSKKPNPEVQAAANNSLGEVLANEGKIQDAQAAYEAAAKVNPTQAGMYYSNEAIVMSRAGQTDATVAAADKAIAADPNKPIPYYLKGQALISKATVDPKTGKIVAPPGTTEAYQKYLELDPNGPFANEVKGVLQGMGETIKSSYKAPKK